MFQKRILEKYLSKLDKSILDEKYKIYCSIFKNSEKQKNIRNSKEEQYQEGFLRDLFVSVLNYTINPEPNYNLVTEQKNTSANKDNRKADGAIIFDNKVKAVIELKGTDATDLNKIESQAFLYKEHNLNCKYVVISNFERLRFYVENAIEYKEFNLFDLSKSEFDILYLCLEVNQIKNDVPLLVKNETVSEEKEITDNFYNDYSVFKRKLFEDICKNNVSTEGSAADSLNDGLVSGVNPNKLLLFKKTQKLLDRILFILFCEDRGLLPANSINTIIQQWEQLKDLDAYQPLYSRFQNYFNRINEGYKSPKNPSEDIFAYNGGLFKPDEILDKIKISDDVLFLYTKQLSNYDFESQISVDILGHIFEHSLTEIEEVQKQLEAEKSGLVVEKTDVGKRKKDGVFYTPAYITKYIVENTIGKLCDDKKEELCIKDSAFSKQKKTSKDEKELAKKLDTYKKWLLNLKILDPACGSGAFLNAALKQLKAEHTLIDYYRAKIYGDSLVFQDVENVILEKNIFGVDINEESVEIAKLSLWLHTAQKDRKLTTLNNNIKCGNSLIDDPKIARQKAFDWKKEFPEVFENGGFDVVIGNPPYIPTEFIQESDRNFYGENYKSAFGRINIYPIFYEKGISLLKSNGFLGFITPYTLLKNQYYIEARKYILENTCIKFLIDFTGAKVFEDATVDSIVLILNKIKDDNNSFEYINEVKNFASSVFKSVYISQQQIISNSDLSFSNLRSKFNFEKLNLSSIPLSKVISFKQGITTGGNKIYIQTDKELEENQIETNLIKKIIIGEDINRYSLCYKNRKIIYVNKNTDMEKYPYSLKYLEQFKKQLSTKRETIKGTLPWYSLWWARSEDLFCQKKLLLRQTGSYPIVSYDENNYYVLDSIHNGISINDNFELKYILCLLNSKLLRFVYENSVNETGKVFAQVKIIYIDPLPIKNIPLAKQQPFIALADKMLSLNADLQKSAQRFIKRVKENLKPAKISSALENFYTMEFADFVKELAKQKVKLTLKQQDEWEDYFAEYKAACVLMQEQINTTDAEINQLVYKLYDLTPEEIAIVASTSGH